MDRKQFDAWRRRRAAEGPSVTLIDLYAAVAAERGLAAVALPAAKRIDHVGSTAVPDLAAKPVVDIQVSVVDPTHESEYVPQLADLGLELRSRDHEHRFFRLLR